MSEKELRDIVRNILKSELAQMSTKKHVEEVVEKEINNLERDIFKKLDKEFLTKKEVKDMIRQTFRAYHKWMWEKKNVWINQI